MPEFLLVCLVLFGIVLGVLWLILPFAVFGIKDKIKETNNKLSEILEAVNEAKIQR